MIYPTRLSMDRPLVTTQSMILPLPTKAALRALLGAVALWWPAPQAALAQGHLDAQYEATLAGIPVGKGAWTIDIGEDQFSAGASGGTSGRLQALPNDSAARAPQ